METRKKKAVFTAEPVQLAQIQAMVKSGQYRSASQFLREAIDEKLKRLRRQSLEIQVERYCDEAVSETDAELIAAQAFDREG